MRTLRLLPPFIHEVTDVGLANFVACLQAANFVAKLGRRFRVYRGHLRWLV